MGRRWFDDLTGDDLADDNVHALVVTLDGDPLAAYDVGHRPGPELLGDLARHLAAEHEARRTVPPLDPGPLDESAEDRPSVDHNEASPEVNESDPVDESAGDPPTAAQPIKSPLVEGVPTGEAERGTVTDAQVRAWNDRWQLGELRSQRRIPAWMRDQYERLDGAEPDDAARRVAERQASTAGTSAADEDPPTPARAGQPGRASGRSNGTRGDDGVTHTRDVDLATGAVTETVDPPAAKPEASVRPAVEPIGDGTGQPASTAAQLERADELAADGKTPRQISSETGVWLSEARAAVRKATQR